jgi:tetratricopeptide (TPR) repeat protein
MRRIDSTRAPTKLQKLLLASLLVLFFLLPLDLPPQAQQQATPAEAQSSAAYREGLALLNSGNYQEALSHFRQSSELAPGKPEPLYLQGVTLTLMGRVQEANQAFKKSLAIDNGFWIAHRGLATNYLRAGQVDAASAELDTVLKVAPKDAASSLLAGEISFAKKNCASALTRFKSVAELVERDTQATLMLAECQIETGQTASADAMLRKLASNTTLEPAYQFKIGWLYGRMGSFEEAVQIFQSLPENYPDPLTRGYALAMAHFELRQYAECIQILVRLQLENIEDGDLFALLGVAYDRLGNTQDAYAAFENGIHVDPKNERNYLNSAALSAHLGKWDLAVRSVNEGIQQLPRSYRLYLCRGLLYQKQGNVLSEQDYRRAVALAPKSPQPYEALALAQIEDGRAREALRLLQEAERAAPKDPGNYYLQAEALVRMGAAVNSPNYHQALRALNTCVALDKEFIYGYYDRGKLELEASDTKDAIADLERARALRPDSTDILYKLAQAYQKAGRTEEAAELFALRQRMDEKQLEDYNQFMLNGLGAHHSAASP